MKISIAYVEKFRLWIAGFLCLSALILTFGALSSVAKTMKTVRTGGGDYSAIMPKVTRTVTDLTPDETAGIIRQMKILHPSVDVVQSGAGRLSVSIQDAALFSEWKAAIADLSFSGGNNDVKFELVTLCGAGCDGRYCLAEYMPRHVKHKAAVAEEAS